MSAGSGAFRFVGPLADLTGDAARDILDRSGPAVEAAAADLGPLLADVRARGDAAVLDAEARFGTRPARLEVPPAEVASALARTPAPVVEALRRARANLETFHRAQLRQEEDVEVVPGLVAGRRSLPLARVGCYAPGGRAAYPSTVLMTVVPAKVAGVREVFVATPAGPDGRVPDVTLAACAVAGADRVFAMGGAQAVFAFASGTTTVPAVDKVVGPGSVWVTAAKALVRGRVGVDAPAGPSEVLVLADESADPAAVAWDLVSQAEHDPLAAAVLVTWHAPLAAAVEAAVAEALRSTPRGGVVQAALAGRGAILLAPRRESALAFADRYAPEHLVLQTRDPAKDLEALNNYGSAFLGAWSSVTLGDYCSGTNHVLPTAGLARFASGLGVEDFQRRPTHQRATREALAALAGTATTLAEAEGLPAHAEAVRARLRPRATGSEGGGRA